MCIRDRCHSNILGVVLDVNPEHTRHPVTISVHIGCGPRNIIDAIYVLRTQPRGSYTSALVDAMNHDDDVLAREGVPSSSIPSAAAQAPNGKPPPSKKRKVRNNGNDDEMSD